MRTLFLIWLAIMTGFGGGLAADSATNSTVGLIQIDGVIGPATAVYISRAIQVAQERKDACLVIQMDTPGGLLDSTKDIVRSFYSAAIPVVVFVAPSSAGATSAGCFITLAADIAAMAPHTTIGAAHVVLSGGGGEEKMDEVMREKLEKYSSSYIESIAEKRGRNVEWARSATLKSESITAEKALELKVVDLIADDVPDLLRKLEGRTVSGHTLRTAGAVVQPIPMAARERLFSLLARPEVMLILMLAAIYGIIGELSSPGAILPGVVGGIALILALYMGSVLPINVAGVALIILSLVLFVADIYATTHGVLTFGGVLAFFLGALMLFNRSDPAFHLSLAYIVPATLLTAAFFLFVVGAGLRAQKLPVRVGRETMVGKVTTAVAPIDAGSGKVFIEGEYWNATSTAPVAAGKPVEVVGIQGLTLLVKPA